MMQWLSTQRRPLMHETVLQNSAKLPCRMAIREIQRHGTAVKSMRNGLILDARHCCITIVVGHGTQGDNCFDADASVIQIVDTYIAQVARKCIGDQVFLAGKPSHVKGEGEKLFLESKDPWVGNFSKYHLEDANEGPMIGMDQKFAATSQKVLAFFDHPLDCQTLELNGGIVCLHQFQAARSTLDYVA